MRRWIFITLLIAVLLPVPRATAQELRASTPEVRQQVLAVIDAQLEAFRDGNVRRAYGYATVALRAQTSLRSFVAIVRTNYPELWNNVRAEPGIVRDDDTRATVLVHVVAKDGGEAGFDYVLLREDGRWRIGSILRHEPGRSNV